MKRRAVVTGAGAGIGARIVRDLLARGWQVAGLDREWAHPPTESDQVLRLTADLASDAQLTAAIAEVRKAWGGLDAVVNNAALGTPRTPIDAVTGADMVALFDVNVVGQFRLIQAARELLADGDRPAIVNLSSIGAQRAFRGTAAYNSAKGAVEAMTRALALDLAHLGIRVNAVAPGMVLTERWQGASPARLAHRAGIVPLGRPADPAEIAAAVAFLAGPESSYITGVVLPVDGGLSVQAYSPADEQAL